MSLQGNHLNDALELTLNETSPNSSEFRAQCQTRFAEVADPSNDVLEVYGKEMVTVSHLDALQATGETDVLVTDTSYVMAGENGTIECVKSNYVTPLDAFNAGETLYFRLKDSDLTDEVVSIQIAEQETLDLSITPAFGDDTGVYIGKIETAYAVQPISDDTVLQVQGGEAIQVRYLDALRASGETDVIVTDACLTNTGTTGTFAVYDQFRFDRDRPENEPITKFRAGDRLIVEIRDADLNQTNAVVDRFEVDLIEDGSRDPIRVRMVEVGANTAVFQGEIQTQYGETSIPGDDVLQVQGGEFVILTYRDALQANGATQVPVRVELLVETGQRTILEIYRAEGRRLIGDSSGITGSFGADEQLRIQLQDKDANLLVDTVEAVQVSITGNLLNDRLVLTLRETGPNRDTFVGNVRTELADIANVDDHALQVSAKEVITVSYIDALTGTGETDVIIDASAVVLGSSAGLLRIVNAAGIDTTFAPEHEVGHFYAGESLYLRLEDLLLSTVRAAETVEVTVTGDKTGDALNTTLIRLPSAEGVFIGSISTRFGMSPIADDILDIQGGEAVSATYVPPPELGRGFAIADSAYVRRGTRGNLTILSAEGQLVRRFNIGAPLHFRLEDADLNSDPFTVEFADVEVVVEDAETSRTSPPMTITLYEEDADANVFRGGIATTYGLSDENGRIALELVGGETITISYEDALVDTGETNVEVSTNCRANLVAWAPFTDEPIVVDGHDDKWPLEQVLKTPKEEGLLWLQWSDDSLYVLAQIYDESIVVPDATKFYQGADALELHFDLDPSESQAPEHLRTTVDPDRYIFWVCPKGAGFKGDQPYVGQWSPRLEYNYAAPQFKVAVRILPNYYVIETRIPFYPTMTGFDPVKTKRQKRIGFNFVIYQSDDQRIHWTGELSDPNDLGLLILRDE